MRIGLVTGEYPPMEGGVGAHCRELARELSDMGHAVFVYSDPRAAEKDNRISMKHALHGWRFRTLLDIRRWAKNNQLDVVNLHFQTAAYRMSPFIHWLPEAVQPPVVTTFHDLRFPYLFPKAGPLRDWIVMRLARASEGVISTNHEDFERIKHLRHAALIPIGSSVRGELPPDFDRMAARARYGASGGDFVIAHFGFINHTKGIETLLAAARSLVNSDIPVKIWLIGGRTGSSDPTNAVYAGEVERKAAALGISDHIVWTGFLDDVDAAAAFAACDVVALLYSDGTSYRRSSLMAAIRHGCAIVTTQPAVDIPAFRDGVNMRIVPTGDPEVTTSVFRELHSDAGQLERLKAGARVLANEFAWDGIAQANLDFFERVIAGVKQ
jgi:glycosyltransferase involved in cell wall biosynthesis